MSETEKIKKKHRNSDEMTRNACVQYIVYVYILIQYVRFLATFDCESNLKGPVTAEKLEPHKLSGQSGQGYIASKKGNMCLK